MAQSTPPTRPAPDVPFGAKAGMGLAALTCVYASVTSSSQFGSGVRAASDGIFAPDATLLAPAAPAFFIWIIIFVGLFGHAVRVWLPDPPGHARRRIVVWPAAMSMLLNALWLFAATRGLVWATLPLMVMLSLTVVLCVEACRQVPAHDLSALVLIDGTYGLHLGWLLVAGPANAAAVLAASGWPATGPAATGIALALLVSATAGALWAVTRYAGFWGIPLAFCWGAVWLVRQRYHGGPESTPVGLATIVAASLVAGWAVLAPRPRHFVAHRVRAVGSKT